MTDGFASRYARTLSATMVAGLVAGFVAAGIGSRLTMRILAVTTHPLPAGFRTEAEAQVGKITTGGTVFLLLIGAVLGAGGALLYLALRRWLPGSGWSRGIVFGLLLVALLGRKVVDPGNKDFQFLTPKPLALALFSSLFIAFGLLVVPLVERFDRGFPLPSWQHWAWAAYLPLVLVALPPIGIVFLVLALFGLAVHRLQRFETLSRLWRGRSVDVAGRAIVGVGTLAGLAFFGQGIADIVTS
ncbi:MAG: hypothetical protein E6G17_08030 [Actinobacteria bacterium]|nr:MAG: hypothetical protein E6G17_08030 [Actinomycetota bacterium]